MRLLTQIRALFVLAMLASHSPLGFHGARDNYLGLFTFIGRFTRFEAAQQFDPTRTAESRGPSRFERLSIAGLIQV